MRSLTALWKFSRPHTIIGSVVSICTMYMIVCEKSETTHFLFLSLALIIGVSCNIFIVGINQIADVELDKINKPYLPIPAGDLSSAQAKIIVCSALFISLALAFYIMTYLFLIIALAALIGWAYSMPPFHLKKHHITAALSITTVRGILLNIGGFMVFNYLVNHTLELPQDVEILTIFIIVFSIAISWFKDLPDVEGDREFNIRSFAIIYSSRAALITGHTIVGVAYLFTIIMKLLEYTSSTVRSFENSVLLYGHIILFILFIINAFYIKLSRHESVKKFYTRFWWFFFAEYALYLIAYSGKVILQHT